MPGDGHLPPANLLEHSSDVVGLEDAVNTGLLRAAEASAEAGPLRLKRPLVTVVSALERAAAATPSLQLAAAIRREFKMSDTFLRSGLRGRIVDPASLKRAPSNTAPTEVFRTLFGDDKFNSKLRQPPTSPEPEARSLASLPGTLDMLMGLPVEMRSGTVAEVHIPWRSEFVRNETKRPGILAWGKALRTTDLKHDELTALRDLIALELHMGALEIVNPEQVRMLTPIFMLRQAGKCYTIYGPSTTSFAF